MIIVTYISLKRLRNLFINGYWYIFYQLKLSNKLQLNSWCIIWHLYMYIVIVCDWDCIFFALRKQLKLYSDIRQMWMPATRTGRPLYTSPQQTTQSAVLSILFLSWPMSMSRTARGEPVYSMLHLTVTRR